MNSLDDEFYIGLPIEEQVEKEMVTGRKVLVWIVMFILFILLFMIIFCVLALFYLKSQETGGFNVHWYFLT